MDIPLIPAKAIVTRQKNGGWFGSDYNMNIYRGCCHGCIYCDSRSACYQNHDFDTVKAKENALALIRRDLGAKRRAGVVGTGSMSDPYNPFEGKLLLTRRALELIYAFEYGIAIATKGTLVTRDIDVLRDIARQAPALVKMTITAADDQIAAKIEPHAPPSSARFEAVEQLAKAGIYTGILLMPVLPFITDSEENITEIVRRAADCGARFIYPGIGVTQREGQREHFHKELERHFPGMAEKYRSAFGGDYMCPSPHAKELYRVFESQCRSHGLLYRMSDIIASYKKWPGEQTSLF